MSALSFFLSIYVYVHTSIVIIPKPFERKFQTYAPLALNISVSIAKNKDIFLDNLSIMIKTRESVHLLSDTAFLKLYVLVTDTILIIIMSII